MLRILTTLGVLATLGISMIPVRADAAMLAPVPAAVLAGQNNVAQVTFWAQPYPYHYSGWRRCPRVRVETPYGWYWERLCVTEPGVVLQRAY